MKSIGVCRQRVSGEESRRADPADQLGSADDPLRPPGAAETTRCGAFQRGALAGETLRHVDMPWARKKPPQYCLLFRGCEVGFNRRKRLREDAEDGNDTFPTA